MDPIGQTFFIDEPQDSVDGVYITKIDLFFRSKSPTYGVEVQIREVENGFPTPRIVPFGRKFLNSSEVNVSADSNFATSFTFNSPVFCKSQTEYFVCILPVGGNPDYNIWTAELGGTDVASGAPIHTNSTVGALYTSSNDRVWVPILKEDIKLNIYRARFIQNSANVYFRGSNYEFFTTSDQKGGFRGVERMYLANGDMHVAYVPISSVSGTFTVSEFVFQSNGTANTATGTVYAANSTVIKVGNVSGRFVTTNTVTGNTSGATGVVGAALQNVVTISSSNTISVPDSSRFSVNDFIYLSSNSNILTTARMVTGIPNATTVALDYPPVFSDNDAYIGYVRGNRRSDNAGLSMAYSSTTEQQASAIEPGGNFLFCAYSTANSTLNFANSSGLRVFGIVSSASAKIEKLINMPYHSLKEFKSYVAPAGTAINWSFKGFGNDPSFSPDSNLTTFNPSTEIEMLDRERVLMSRSNELTLLPGGRTGNSSYILVASMTTNSDKVSPVVDLIMNKAQILNNRTYKDAYLTTYVGDASSITGTFQNFETVSQSFNSVKLANVSGTFAVGEKVYQGTSGVSNFANGTVFFANSTVLKVKNCLGTWVTSPNNVVGATSGATANVTFVSNNNPTGSIRAHAALFGNTLTGQVYNASGTFEANVAIVGQTSNASATIDTLNYFDEATNPLGPSRYISKNIILAEGQDAEDVKVLLTAYKPPNSNVHVYVRVSSSEDPDSLANKAWSKLKMTTSEALFSSPENQMSFIELEYDFPSSNLIQANSVTTNTSSNNITLSTTDSLANNQFVYLTDSTSGSFNVRRIHQVVNNTVVELTARPSFTSTNAAYGVIPGLENRTAAFKLSSNSGIVRYVSNTDVVYDSYKNLAVKIVLTAESGHMVPRVADMRTIALQI